MKGKLTTDKRHHRLHALGSLMLLSCLVIAGMIIHHIYGSFSLETFQSIIKGTGEFGFFIYILCYTIGIIFFVPAMVLLAVVGGLIFGPWIGLLALQCGSLVAASVVFAMVRFGFSPLLEREESKNLIPHWIRQMGHDNGLLLLVYARTFMLPASIINYGVSSLPITFSDYFIGTLLGSLPHNLALALLCGVASDAILQTKWSALLQWDLVPAAILTVFNVYLAHVLNRKNKGKRKLSGGQTEG